jgi:hypothetical protein
VLVTDRQATSPIKEGDKHAQALSRRSSKLVDVCRPGQLRVKGHPEAMCCLDPPHWLLKNWAGLGRGLHGPKF